MFISIWAGKTLADTGSLVNYNYEPCEMCSSLFHAWVLALLWILIPSCIFTANKLLGILCGCGCLYILFLFRRTLFGGERKGILAYTLASLLLATNPVFLYWNLGGLETPYYALFMLLYGTLLTYQWRNPNSRQECWIAIVSSIGLFLRPESFFIIFVNVFFAALVFWRHRRVSSILMVAVVPTLVQVGLLAYRMRRFGLLCPNSALAKYHALRHAFYPGLSYTYRFILSNPLMLIAAVAVMLMCLRTAYRLVAGLVTRNDRGTLDLEESFWLGGITLITVVFVVRAGGDWMEFFRFYAPIVPLAIVLCIVSASQWCGYLLGRLRIAHVALIVTILAGLGVMANIRQTKVYPATSYRLTDVVCHAEGIDTGMMSICWTYARDMKAVGEFLDQWFGANNNKPDARHTVIHTAQMGLVPYLIRERYQNRDVRFVDFAGICDPEIARLAYAAKTTIQEPSDLLREIKQINKRICKSRNANMFYFLSADENMRRDMAQQGFKIVWDREFAVVFYKAPPSQAAAVSP